MPEVAIADIALDLNDFIRFVVDHERETGSQIRFKYVDDKLIADIPGDIEALHAILRFS